MNVAAKVEAALDGGWEANGWALFPGFLDSDDLSKLRAEADRLLEDQALFQQRGSVPNSATRSDRLDPVIDLSSSLASQARDPRLLSIVNRLLGDNAQLLKDKFIAKPPGAPGYGTHQDGAYWPGLGVDASRFLTAVIFLDDATIDKGPIECAPGHHQALLTDPGIIADPDEASLGPFVPVKAKAGDLMLLHALTPHRSGPNTSSEMRRALLFTYGVDPRPDLYNFYHQLQQSIRL